MPIKLITPDIENNNNKFRYYDGLEVACAMDGFPYRESRPNSTRHETLIWQMQLETDLHTLSSWYL